jgi:hypothetical protein
MPYLAAMVFAVAWHEGDRISEGDRHLGVGQLSIVPKLARAGICHPGFERRESLHQHRHLQTMRVVFRRDSCLEGLSC